MDDNEMDDRFSHVITDPRFRTLRKSDKKVKVDKRFEKMFTEKRFKLKYSVDKRGKRTNDDNSEDYKKFYNVSDSDKGSDEEKDPQHEQDEECMQPLKDIDSEDLKRPTIPNARGLESDEDNEYSSSSESEDSSDESEELDHKWNEWDKDVPKIESSTKRLAVCNLDWDRINASDLFILLNSFKPSGGSILSVKIFPSELGLQRMKVEAERGPLPFIKTKDTHKLSKQSNDDCNDEDNQGTDDPEIVEQLRQYEMMRLQYFYAVVECDSLLTAEVLYNELDGMEYESSSTALDLRFIADDVVFGDESEPKSQCCSLPDLSSYKAPQFINSALQQSKVSLTWDQTDPKRKEVFEKAFNKEDDDDLKAYLATSDEEDDEEEFHDFNSSEESGLKTKDKINKYKDLLNSLNETEDKNEGNVEMEISWEPNLKDMTEDIINKKERNKDMSAFEQNFTKIKEKRKQSKNEIHSMSEESEEEISDKTIDKKSKYKEKRKKKNQKSNERNDPNLELLFMDSSDASNKKHFNYKNIVESESNPKRKQMISDSFKFDADDPRFGAVYTSHMYNVDPSDPHYKKTEAFEQIMNRTTKKIKANELESVGSSHQNKSSNSWTQLVRNVKNKSQSIQNRKPNNLHIKQNKFKS